MTDKVTVGFIGLGKMGRGMALNLAKAGYPLVVFDAFASAMEPLIAAGAQAAGSPADVAAWADVIFTSLPGLGIIGALTLAALTGQKRYFAISTVFAALVGAALSVQTSAPDSLTLTAIAEGCVGPQTFAIAACAIIAGLSAASLAWLWLRDRPADRI